MASKGRPRKDRPLYMVKDWIEYTSDSDSDCNNVQKNVLYDIGSTRRQEEEQHHELQEEEQHRELQEEQQQIHPHGEHLIVCGCGNGFVRQQEQEQEEDQEHQQIVLHGHGHVLHEEEQQSQHNEVRGRQLVSLGARRRERHDRHQQQQQPHPQPEEDQDQQEPQHNEVRGCGHVRQEEDQDQQNQQEPQHNEVRGRGHVRQEEDQDQHVNEEQQQADNIQLGFISETTDSEDAEDEHYDSIFEKLKSDWMLIEIDHKVSKTATDLFWDAALKYFPKLKSAPGNKRTQKFKSIRRKTREETIPTITFQFGYENRETGEIEVVNQDTTPIKQFPPSMYEKKYEIGTIKVIIYLFTYVQKKISKHLIEQYYVVW